jgi:hypothetical protein
VKRDHDRACAGPDATAHGTEDLQWDVFSHLYDIPFIGQRKIGKRGLAKKRAMDDLIALSQRRRTVSPGSAEIEGKKISAIGIIARPARDACPTGAPGHYHVIPGLDLPYPFPDPLNNAGPFMSENTWWRRNRQMAVSGAQIRAANPGTYNTD